MKKVLIGLAGVVVLLVVAVLEENAGLRQENAAFAVAARFRG